MFSVIIPTYNNLNYLKICLKSLEKNSKYNNEIIIHINEGVDGTIEYLSNLKHKYSISKTNEGVCVAFNKAVKLSSKKYIVLGHDDMYFCPGWDQVFADEIFKIGKNKDFFMSGTMIQPFKSYIELDCGKTFSDFNEEKLLSNFDKISFNDFQGTHWQPSLIPISTWNKVNGFSEEFSPGLGSDPDFNMKLWNVGVRIFKGLAKCRVYHFSSISLRKKAWNNGAKIFLKKWGITIKFFKKYYLKSDTKYRGELSDPETNVRYFIDLLKCKFQLLYYKILN